VVTFQVIGGIVSLSIVNLCRARCVWVSGGIDDFCRRQHLGYDRDGVGGGSNEGGSGGVTVNSNRERRLIEETVDDDGERF
jgi:hypothetical protein